MGVASVREASTSWAGAAVELEDVKWRRRRRRVREGRGKGMLEGKRGGAAERKRRQKLILASHSQYFVDFRNLEPRRSEAPRAAMKLALLTLFCLAAAVAADGHGHEHGGQACSHDHGEPQVRYAPVIQWP